MELHGRELSVDVAGEDVRLLHAELAQLGLPVPPDEQHAASFGPGTAAAVRRFQSDHAISASGVVDAATAATINQAVAGARPPNDPPAGGGWVVSGHVVSADRPGVGGLTVQIVDKNIGPDVPLAEGTTGGRGAYVVSFSIDVLAAGKPAPDLQVRVSRGGTLLGTSDVHYNASPTETIDVFLPASAAGALPSEYETLTAAIAGHYQGALRDLKETDAQQDITYLANKTGWDARAVALAALADRFSVQPADAAGAPAIPPAAFYGLFRAGLPADDDLLFHTSATTLEATWTAAAAQDLIPSTLTDDLPGLLQRFQALSAQRVLAAPAPTGVSSLQEMLSASGLDEAQQQTFAELWTAQRSDPSALWQQVSDALGAATAARLEVDGKLGFLTINNAPLVEAIHAQVGGDTRIADPVALVAAGFHSADKWGGLLSGDMPIPPEIVGDSPDERRASYARYLAGQIRLSYPTASIAELVKSGTLPVSSSDSVHEFLVHHQDQFEIGAQPVEAFVAHNKLDVPAEAVTGIKRLQRVYQITPNDDAMATLLKRGIDSAYRIAAQGKEDFVAALGDDLGAEDAALVHDRAVHVHNTVLNLAVAYLMARNGTAIGVHSPAHIIDPSPKPADAQDVIAYSTLESLFGSQDFCACEDCRSVLSPAAYLVDLLELIDVAPTETEAKAGKENPQTVLLERRPDIQHLPLTCENTNTALPYIDVVNEVLEYYVANGVQPLSLQGYTGHDTNGVASPDLLATPQFVLDAAYAKLADERFPDALPFDRSLETLRRYFEKFEVPLAQAMETLRKNDDVDRGANPYGWLDILIEELQLSRGDFELLTDIGVVPLWRLYGLPNGTSDSDVVAAVSNAQKFAARVGIDDEDLLAVLTTRFVNPNSDLIPKLERLGVPFTMLAALKTKNDAPTDALFDAAVAANAVPPDPAEYGGDIKAWVKNDTNYARIMGLITLAVPATAWAASTTYALGATVRPAAPDPGSTLFYSCTQAGTSGSSEPTWPTAPGDVLVDGTVQWTCVDEAGCQSFAYLAFRDADPAKVGDPVGADAFIRLARFIRLWTKLGWTIDDVDAAICALYRGDLAPLTEDDLDSAAELDQGFKTLLPRLGAVRRVLRSLGLSPSRDLRPLLACWADIDTKGYSSLYRQLFLNRAVGTADPAFADDGYGEFLSDTTAKLADHAEALRAAFNLTADELALVVDALGFDPNTPLRLDNVSAILRRAWLARRLKVSVRELLLLVRLTGIDPFAAPDPPALPMLNLIDLVQSLARRSLKTAVVLYLIWNQDLSGRSAPDPAQVTELARDLRSDFASIEDELAAKPDASGDAARARMTLVYGQETSDAFFALLDDTIVVDVAYTHSAPTLENAITSADPNLAYDDFRHRLTHTGLVTSAIQTTLKSVGGVSADFQNAIDALYAASDQLKGLFFNRFPELQAPYATAASAKPEERHDVFVGLFEPELARRRKRQQAVQRLSSTVDVDPALAQALLDPRADPLPLHAAGDAKRPLLDDVASLETPGLAVEFFYRDTASGSPDLAFPSVAVSYASDSTRPLPANPSPGAAISGIWTGRIEAPETGYYNLIVETDADATVTLVVDGQTVALVRNGSLWRNGDPNELAVGTLHDLTLTVEKVKNALSLRWETPKRPRETIPPRYLYPPSIFVPFADAYLRFLKTASLASALKLSADEIVHFATEADYAISGDGWLNVLPTTTDPSEAEAKALLDPLRALLDYAGITARFAPTDTRLLEVLDDPAAATKDAQSLLYTLTRWDPAALVALLGHFGLGTADLANVDVLARVDAAFALVQKLGVGAAALVDATTNAPTGAGVAGLDAALRARYDADAWRDLVRPIHDEMRGLQRDALVAYVLHQMGLSVESAHIDTPDKLFEYFLMDVQMDPCIETSRIRHALSSVQLFVERGLINLEPRVSATAVDGRRWEWMKRYRIWEANRKVFLWPENWLEPELRDDQSPFFAEAMSELLQGDITDDRAADVLVTYLSKLEEVAKLEPCGVFYIPSDPKAGIGETAHVVARTAGAKRKYFYRRLEYGGWTPWQEIKLDIEDNPVVPVVWNDRLLLFWLRILKKGPDQAATPAATAKLVDLKMGDVPTDPPTIRLRAVLCWSEYYNGKWQPTRTSDVDLPTELSVFSRTELQLGAAVEGDALRIYVNDPRLTSYSMAKGPNAGKSFTDESWPGSFLLYTTHSLPVRGDEKVTAEGVPAKKTSPRRDFAGDPAKSLAFKYSDGKSSSVTEEVLHPVISFRIVSPKQELPDPWNAPFLYDDVRHAFYVTTAEQPALVSSHQGFGRAVSIDTVSASSLSQVVAQQLAQQSPRPALDGTVAQDGLGAVDTSRLRRLVTEDAYIHEAIPATGVVTYGDKKIGPLGALSDAGPEVGP